MKRKQQKDWSKYSYPLFHSLVQLKSIQIVFLNVQESDGYVDSNYSTIKCRLKRMRKIFTAHWKGSVWRKNHLGGPACSNVLSCINTIITAWWNKQNLPGHCKGKLLKVVNLISKTKQRQKSPPKAKQEGKAPHGLNMMDQKPSLPGKGGREEGREEEKPPRSGMWHTTSAGDVVTQKKAQRAHFGLSAGWKRVDASCVLGNVHQRYPTVILFSSECEQRTVTVSDSSLMTVLS